MTPFIAMFPGQGSQVVGMGQAFCANSALARDVFAEANDALGFDLAQLCFEGPIERLTLTEFAQPAILTVSTVAFRLFGHTPVAAAGHSLGEYSALVAAGALEFADAVRLVNKRGRFMQDAVPEGTGRMSAVLGATPEEIAQILVTVPTGIKEIANMNCPGQTVVSGDVAGIEALGEALVAAGFKVMPLKVSAPFHCSMMKPAAELLRAEIEKLDVKAPAFPVYSNVTAQPVRTAAEIKQRLYEQVCAPVRWTESMANMIADTAAPTAIEFGAGGVLANLLKRINKEVARVEVSSPETLEKALA